MAHFRGYHIQTRGVFSDPVAQLGALQAGHRIGPYRMRSPGQTQASQPGQGQPSPRCMHGKGTGARQINDMWGGRIYRRPYTWKGAATAVDTRDAGASVVGGENGILLSEVP